MTLTANQTTALRVLSSQEYPTIREVAEVGRMSQASARATVYRLMHLGLAETAGSAISGGATFTITNAGRDHLDNI